MYNIHTRKCATFIPANVQHSYLQTHSHGLFSILIVILSVFNNITYCCNSHIIFSSKGKMQITDHVLRRAFLCCLLLPILGFVSIIMFGHQHSQSASSSDDHSEAHRRTKRQDPGIGDDSPHTYEVKSSRYVSSTSLFGGSGSYIVDMYCSFCGINN